MIKISNFIYSHQFTYNEFLRKESRFNPKIPSADPPARSSKRQGRTQRKAQRPRPFAFTKKIKKRNDGKGVSIFDKKIAKVKTHGKELDTLFNRIFLLSSAFFFKSFF